MKYKNLPEGYKAKNKFEEEQISTFEKNQELPFFPWLVQNINIESSIYFIVLHILTFMSFFYIKLHLLKYVYLIASISGFGITAGAHRLWAHKSYKASSILRYFLMVLNSISNQGTIFYWVRDHRVHHKYSDTKSDPHNSLRGFFFSHIGWVFLKKDPRVHFAGKEMYMKDILSLPEVQLQKRFDPWWNLSWCFIFPTLFGKFILNESYTTSFLLFGVLRYTFSLHSTWLVNSLAHYYGNKPYNENIIPVENHFVSFCTLGEGYHNWHHTYPFDYAASEHGLPFQYNPTKLFIDFFSKLNMVWDRKRMITKPKR